VVHHQIVSNAIEPTRERCLPSLTLLDRFQHAQKDLGGHVLCEIGIAKASVEIPMYLRGIEIVDGFQSCHIELFGSLQKLPFISGYIGYEHASTILRR
jgi:hypothetical protein